MDWLWHDVKYAARTLRKSPGFTIVAIATLALAIGATTAVFTVVDAVLLKPLAYPDAGTLVVAWERVPRMSDLPTGPNPRHADVWRRRATAFADMTLLRHSSSGLAVGAEHPQLVGTVTCLPNLFGVLRVAPLAGRAFLPEEGEHGHDTTAIITYALWQRVFAGDPKVIGRTIRLGDVTREIVGILPASFHFPNANALRSFRSGQAASNVPEPAVFLPAAIDPTQFGWNGDYGNWIVLGRLESGVDPRQAESQLTAIQADVAQQMPAGVRDARGRPLQATVELLQDVVVRDARVGLWLLMAAVTAVMLMACLNLANAQVGRALARRRETAVRIALGAARWRLLATVFSENALLTAAGLTVGLLLATVALRLLRESSPIDLPRLDEVHLNLAVLLFSAAIGTATMLLSGLLPALTAARSDAQSALQANNGRSLGGRHGHRVRSWLIRLQVAGCVLLLLLTGLFAQSLGRLLQQDKGFETANVAIAEVRLSLQSYAADRDRVTFDAAVLKNLADIPAVESAGLVSAMPLEGETWIEGLHRRDRPQDETPLINLRWVSPGYFETMGERVMKGRPFEERDRTLQSVVLSESEARALFGSDDPIGYQVTTEGRTFTIIGVVADSRSTSLKTPPARTAYLHYVDRPPYVTFFFVRAAQPPEALMTMMRQAIWRYAADITIARVTPFDAQVTQSLATERFQTVVLFAFGASALMLAMLGIYGVLTHTVAARRQEIGVRMALGASRPRIYWLACRAAGDPVIAGLAMGTGISLLSQALILKTVYGIQGVDPRLVLVVVSVLVAAAGAAAFPALRRAVSVDPIETLRSD